MVLGIVPKQAVLKFSLCLLKMVKPERWKFLPQLVNKKTGTYKGRPVDVAILKDGSLLVSDDYAGAIYRISYSNEEVASIK